MLQVAKDPGGRRGSYSTHGARIDDPGDIALAVLALADLDLVTVPAAHNIPVTGGCHGVGVVRVVHDKDHFAGQFDTCIHTVIAHHAVRLVREAGQGVQVTGIVAMDHVHRQPEFLQAVQGAGRD